MVEQYIPATARCQAAESQLPCDFLLFHPSPNSMLDDDNLRYWRASHSSYNIIPRPWAGDECRCSWGRAWTRGQWTGTGQGRGWGNSIYIEDFCALACGGKRQWEPNLGFPVTIHSIQIAGNSFKSYTHHPERGWGRGGVLPLPYS